ALLMCTAAVHAASLISAPPSGWTTWAPRDEIAPRTFIDTVHYRTRPGSLAISGNSNPAAYGGWVYTAQGIAAGKWYRFQGYYRQQGASNERNQVIARLEWHKADGKRAGQPDYAYEIKREGEWNRLALDVPAPEAVNSVTIQLYLAHAP